MINRRPLYISYSGIASWERVQISTLKCNFNLRLLLMWKATVTLLCAFSNTFRSSRMSASGNAALLPARNVQRRFFEFLHTNSVLPLAVDRGRFCRLVCAPAHWRTESICTKWNPGRLDMAKDFVHKKTELHPILIMFYFSIEDVWEVSSVHARLTRPQCELLFPPSKLWIRPFAYPSESSPFSRRRYIHVFRERERGVSLTILATYKLSLTQHPIYMEQQRTCLGWFTGPKPNAVSKVANTEIYRNTLCNMCITQLAQLATECGDSQICLSDKGVSYRHPLFQIIP